MATKEIHKNDLGTIFTFTVKDSGTALDISTANTSTSRQVIFKSPSGTVNTQTASFSGTGSDGVMVLTITTDLFDTVGSWRLQGVIQFGTTTSLFHTNIYDFDVKENLEA